MFCYKNTKSAAAGSLNDFFDFKQAVVVLSPFKTTCMNDLLNFLLPVHNFLRWVILILLVLAIGHSATRMNGNWPYAKSIRSLGLYLMIATHLNAAIGLFQWFTSAWGLNAIRSMGFGAVMKSSVYRFWAVEHFLGMLIAVILITMARRVARQQYIDRVKHKRTFWLLVIALLIILASVPWPFREGIARPWIRGF